MNSQPTYDDVNLILRLYELRREEKLRGARAWYTNQFKTPATLDDFMAQCPFGSESNTSFRMVTSYWDMVAAFITSGVLNQELALQTSGELLFVWTRIRNVAPAIRELLKNPRFLANLETVGTAAINRMNEADPRGYETFVERIVKMTEQTAAVSGAQS